MQMTETEKYLFDLCGFLVVRGVLGPEEISKSVFSSYLCHKYFRANEAIDRHIVEACERVDPSLRNAASGSNLSGDGKTGRCDLGGMLGWSNGDNAVFRSVLNHPRLVPILNELVGPGYRLDHHPLCIISNAGCEGFSLHGGSLRALCFLHQPTLCQEQST